MDGFLLPTAVDSDHPEQTGAVTAAMVPDALQSYAAPRAEGSVDSLASTAASFATHPAAEQLVIVAANNPMDTGGVGAVSATSVEPAQSYLTANGLPGPDAHPHPQMTTAVAVELGDALVTFWQGSDSSSDIGDMVFSGSGTAELDIPTNRVLNAAAPAQIQEGQEVDDEEYVLSMSATAMTPAEVDTLATSPGDVSDVVEVSSAASGLDQPAAAAEDVNAALGAELAAISAQLAAEEADISAGPTCMSTQATEALLRTNVVAKDGGVLAVIFEDDTEDIAASLAASESGQATEAAAAATGTAAELAASPPDSHFSEVYAEHSSVQTAQAAATDEIVISLATECVSEAVDDAAAGPQTSGFLPAEPAQVVSQQYAAVALTLQKPRFG